MKLYLTGRNISTVGNLDGNQTGNVWEFIGVFDDEDKAKKSCIQDNDFIVPIILNEFDNKEVKDWIDIVYPLFKGIK